jgi:DNA-directed RNA polymerase subunit M/transcription elongation factor TFIIS
VDEKPEEREQHDGCEPVTCPNPKCNQVFLDLDQDFWERGNENIDCRKCKERARFVSSMQDRKKPSKIIYMYRCDSCKAKFTRKIPGMKKFCASCKTEYYMFWNLLLKLPGYSASRPPEYTMLESP